MFYINWLSWAKSPTSNQTRVHPMKLDQCPLTDAEKERMVAEAAYFRFANRNFTSGDPVKDWVAAEADIEKSLKFFCGVKPQRKALADYQRTGFVETVKKWFHRSTSWAK